MKEFTFTAEETVPYSAHKLYSTTLDINSYSNFLPWCNKAKVIRRTPELILAELHVGFGYLNGNYISKVEFSPPTSEQTGWVRAQAVPGGPFEYLTSLWQFQIVGENSTHVKFNIKCKFKSAILQGALNLTGAKVHARVIQAFKEQAALTKD